MGLTEWWWSRVWLKLDEIASQAKWKVGEERGNPWPWNVQGMLHQEAPEVVVTSLPEGRPWSVEN